MAKTLDAAGVKRLIQEIKGANKNLNAPIPISTENTTESMAQNVKNIADYVAKAKAAGIDTTKSFRITLEIEGYPVEGSYDTQYSYACGLQITDDGYALLYNIDVTTGEVFTPCEIVTARSIQKVTSSMLSQGARKPIILTPNTTEVDGETYQKLLSDDVDVIFKTSIDDANLCTLTYKVDDGNFWSLYFTCFSIEGEALGNIYFYAYKVAIEKNAPHTCTINVLKRAQTLDDAIESYDYIKKAILSPVLQEIDLTGTDAERKAKLDQFEADWKALTGASDLTGARFVGKFVITEDIERNVTGIMTYSAGDTATEANDNCFYGICNGYSFSEQKSQIAVKVSCTDGSLTITPLFSHLEAITIYTDNTPEHMQANLDNIAAYEANLQALGVDTNNNYIIPIKFDEVDDEMGTSFPFGGFITTYGGYEGFVTSTLAEQYKPKHIWISQAGGEEGKVYLDELAYENQLSVYTPKTLNAKSLEAITIKTGNTPEDKAANVAAIKAYVDNLKALGVDTTKGCTIPFVGSPSKYCGILFGRGDEYYEGVCNSHSTRVTLGVAINVDGAFYVTNNLNTISEYQDLTTHEKKIIPAINEVNALAKGYSTIFTPIELTTETAQNKTTIDARMAAFTAQGISLTNGCCIPVTYKGVYAGNISLINGDWYGLLVKNTNNPADNINIKLSADGTITEGNSAQ